MDEKEPGQLKGGRIHLLDEMRGFAILLVVAFHVFITAGDTFHMAWGVTLYRFFSPVQPFFAGWFVVLCGISCRLSHNNLKRGLFVAGAAALVSLVLWLIMRDLMIWFGILHFLAVSILLFVPLRPLLDKIPPLAGLIACAALTLVTWWVPHGGREPGFFGIKGLFEISVPALLDKPWLYPLGFSYVRGSDYFPLLPWLFCFLGGTFLGVWAKAGTFPAWTYKSRAPALSFIGRHTLLIYLAHQPAAFAVLWLIDLVT